MISVRVGMSYLSPLATLELVSLAALLLLIPERRPVPLRHHDYDDENRNRILLRQSSLV